MKSVDGKYGITSLGEVKWALGTLIKQDHTARAVYISQEAFISLMLTCFNLANTAPLAMPITTGSFFSVAICLTTQEERAGGCACVACVGDLP